MVDINFLISQVPEMTELQRSRLIQALLAASRPHPSESTEDMVDLMPLDAPVESNKNPETGVLQIRYPYPLSHAGSLQWRVVEVTRAAQVALLAILYDSIQRDEKAGRTPPIQGKLQ